MRRVLIGFVAMFGLTAGACNPPPEATPQQVLLIRADDVVVALGTLQHAAIELNKAKACTEATPPVCAPLLSEANTRIVVENVTSSLKALGPDPTSIRSTVKSTIDEIERRLDAAGKTKLLPYLQAVKVVVGFIPALQGVNQHGDRDLTSRRAARARLDYEMAGAYGRTSLAHGG